MATAGSEEIDIEKKKRKLELASQEVAVTWSMSPLEPSPAE